MWIKIIAPIVVALAAEVVKEVIKK